MQQYFADFNLERNYYDKCNSLMTDQTADSKLNKVFKLIWVFFLNHLFYLSSVS